MNTIRVAGWMSSMEECAWASMRTSFTRCIRERCGHSLGTCSIAGWNLHGHHRLASARCSRGKDDPVGRSCSSCHRRRRQIGFLRCEARCNRATNGLADHNCSSCHHRRLHGHRPPWGSRGKCVPPRCSCSKSWTCRHHHRLNAAWDNLWKCVPTLRSCSTNDLPS